MAISEKNVRAIEAARDELRRTADMLQAVLDGKSTLSAAGREAGLSPQRVNDNLALCFRPYIKARLATVDDLAKELEDLRTPSDKLMFMIFWPAYKENAHAPGTLALLPDYDPDVLWDAAYEALSKRELAVIKCRTGENAESRPMSLRETAKEFNVTMERLRQIEAKALRKLRNPGTVKRLFPALTVTGIEVMEQIEKAASESLARYEKAMSAYRAMDLVEAATRAYEEGRAPDQETLDGLQRLYEDGSLRGPAAADGPAREILLQEVDLSARAYNCLARAGKKTLNEVAGMTKEEIWTVRNIGRRTIEEIVGCIRVHMGVARTDWLA